MGALAGQPPGGFSALNDALCRVPTRMSMQTAVCAHRQDRQPGSRAPSGLLMSFGPPGPAQARVRCLAGRSLCERALPEVLQVDKVTSNDTTSRMPGGY